MYWILMQPNDDHIYLDAMKTLITATDLLFNLEEMDHGCKLSSKFIEHIYKYNYGYITSLSKLHVKDGTSVKIELFTVIIPILFM